MADPSPALRLLFKARSVLGLSQREFADAVDSSVRTVARWEANQSGPRPDQLHNAARLVHSVDPTLARDLAALGGTTLEQLGFVPPQLPAPLSPAPSAAAPLAPAPLPARSAQPPVRLLVDAVVYAAAEALEATPGPLLRSARATVAAAFMRALDLGLSAEDVARATTPPSPPPPEQKAPPKARARP